LKLVLTLLCALALPAGAAELKPWSGPTPPLELVDLDGKRHRLADYRGSVVVINFWATWCVPCRDEMPSLERLRASVDGKRVVILAVNLAEPDSRVRKFLDAMPLRFPILMDREATVAKAWQAKLLPATFVVGPDGVIRYRHLGELDWSTPQVRAQIVELIK
jgi:peroxiredoxin